MQASRRGGNSLTANHIDGALTVRCCDGGGLYTLGPQPGSSITGNYIVQAPSTGNAIYHDNGSVSGVWCRSVAEKSVGWG